MPARLDWVRSPGFARRWLSRLRLGRARTPTNGGDTVAPSIVAQPASQAARVGDTVNFLVVATGSEPLTYQWKKNGSAIAARRGQLWADGGPR